MKREDQRELLARILGGESATSIAKDYGLTSATIRQNAVFMASKLYPHVGWTMWKIKSHRGTLKIKLRMTA